MAYDTSRIRSFAFSTLDGGGWRASAVTEIGPVTATGRTFEEAQAALHELIQSKFAEAHQSGSDAVKRLTPSR